MVAHGTAIRSKSSTNCVSDSGRSSTHSGGGRGKASGRSGRSARGQSNNGDGQLSVTAVQSGDLTLTATYASGAEMEGERTFTVSMVDPVVKIFRGTGTSYRLNTQTHR